MDDTGGPNSGGVEAAPADVKREEAPAEEGGSGGMRPPTSAADSQQPSAAPRSGSKLFLSMAVSKMADAAGRGAQAKALKDACAEFQGR